MGHSVFIGFGTGGGGGGGADPLLFPLDLYVASTGNDANPGTPAQPVLTMAGAWSKVRDLGGNLTYQIGAPIRVHVAAFPAGTLAWTPVPGYQAINESGQVIVNGDGALQGVEDGFTIFAAGAAGVGTTALSVGFATAPDALLGRTIEFLSPSPAAGQRRLVRNNTATEIIPDAAFSAAPLLGDLFRILSPAASINLASSADIQVSDDINVTLINLDADGAGSGSTLRTLGVTCLKLYGCTFSNAAYISFADSNIYAGLALNQVPENIGLDSLWTALGGVQDWIGWGISSAADTVAAGLAPVQTLTGYVVSFGSFIAGLSNGLQGGLTLFGGFANSLQIANCRLQFRPQTPAPLIQTLLRGAGNIAALYMFASEGTVLGGDAALTLEGDNLVDMVVSTIEWLGVCTLTAVEIAWKMTGGTGHIRLSADEDLNFSAAVGFAIYDSADMSVICDEDSAIVGNISQFVVVVSRNSTFTVTPVEPLDLPSFNNITINCVPPGSGFFAIDSSNITLAANPTINGAVLAFLILNQSNLFCNDVIVDAPDGAAMVCVNEVKATFDNLAIDAALGFVAAFQSEVTIVNNAQINTTDGPIGVVVFGGRFDCNSSSGLNAPGTPPGAAAFVIQEGSTVALAGDVTCSVETFLVDGNSSLALAFGTLSSATASCFKVSTGSNVWFYGTGGNINAALDGIDCTGGGRAFFSDLTIPPTFTVGGNELVVGPGVLESSTLALALPNPGDAFSNAGATSSISRKL
jgi:hypothetical protein